MHTIALADNGVLLSWGCNDDGALGREGIQNSPGLVKLPVPIDKIAAGDSHSLFCNFICAVVEASVFPANFIKEIAISLFRPPQAQCVIFEKE